MNVYNQDSCERHDLGLMVVSYHHLTIRQKIKGVVQQFSIVEWFKLKRSPDAAYIRLSLSASYVTK